MIAIRIALPMICMLAYGTASADWEASILPRDFKTETSLSKALTTARQSGQHVIVYYRRTNCPPCTQLQARLRKESVAKPYRESYVFTAVWGSSMGTTERESYRQRFGVQGAPTWIVFNNNGDYVCTSTGGFETEEAGAQLHQTLRSLLADPSRGPSSNAPKRCA